MALPDPELELLQELLADDPGADVFVTVGEELMRRDRHAEAVSVLAAGVEAAPGEKPGWRLLVLAAQRDSQNLRALAALSHMAFDRARDLDLARAEVLALEGSGQIQRARAAAETVLRYFPGDIVAEAVLERLSAPAQARGNSPDPLVTVARAEEYVAIGRADRAIRLYRRLLHRAPDDPGLAARLRELQEQPVQASDDLSEDLTAEEPEEGPPPAFSMPAPQIGLTPIPADRRREEERTDPNVDLARARERLEQQRVGRHDARTDPDAFDLFDDEPAEGELLDEEDTSEEIEATTAPIDVGDEITLVIGEEDLVAVDEVDGRTPYSRFKRRSLLRR